MYAGAWRNRIRNREFNSAGVCYLGSMDKELRTRIDTLREAAIGGDVQAQVDLAVMYSHGEEVPVDNEEALRWYGAAARGGDQFAQFMLGLWHFLEDPSDSALSHAAHWLRKAAHTRIRGRGPAPRGGVFSPPRGGTEHGARRSAGCASPPILGRPRPCTSLGVSTVKIFSSPPDERRAIRFLSKASQYGHWDAAFLKWPCATWTGMGWRRTSFEARKCFEVATRGGDAEALHELGTMCLHGLGGPHDKPAALRLFLKAAHLNHVDGLAGFVHQHTSGRVNEEDPDEAMHWIEWAAPRGDAVAQELLGLAYLHGTYRDEDPVQAFRWFLRAANTAAPAVRPQVGEALLMDAETTADPVHAYALALIAESLDTDGAADRIELLSYRLTKAQAEDAHRLLGPGFFTTRH